MYSFFNIKCIFFALLFNFSFSFCTSNIPVFSEKEINRLQNLKDIENKIKRHGYVFISGFGGMGKSKIAKHFSNNKNSSYEIKWWIDGKKDLLNQVETLINQINKKFNTSFTTAVDHKVLLMQIIDFAKKNKIKILLIFDGLEDHEQIRNAIEMCTTKYINIIITSRKNSSYESKITITEFSDQEALLVLKSILPFYEKEELSHLAETLKNYPLAITQAGYFLLHNRGITIENYIKQYIENKRFLWEKEEAFLSEFETSKISVRSTLSLSLKSITKNQDLLKKLLIILSIHKNQFIPEEAIRKISLSMNISKDNFDELLSFLVNNNFISIIPSNKKNDRLFTIHEIIQAAILSESSNEDIEIVLSKTLSFYLSLLKKKKNTLINFFKNNSTLVDNTISAIQYAKPYKKLEIISHLINILLLDYFIYVKRNHHKTFEIIYSTYNLLDKIMDPIFKSRFLSSAGDVLSLHKQGENITEDIFSRMKIFLERNLIEDPYEIVRLQNSIAQNLLLKTNSKEAKKYTDKSLKLSSKFKYPEQKIPSYYFALWTDLELMRYKSALLLVEKAIDLFPYTTDTPIKFYIYNFKSFINLRLKDYSKALSAANLSINECKKYFGDHHTDTIAEALTYKAAAENNLGFSKKALSTINSAIDSYNIFYRGGDKIIDQAFSNLVKGDIYLFLNNDIEALKQYIQCVNIFLSINAERKSFLYKGILLRIIYTLIKIKKTTITKTYINELNSLFPDENINPIIYKNLTPQKFLSQFE